MFKLRSQLLPLPQIRSPITLTVESSIISLDSNITHNRTIIEGSSTRRTKTIEETKEMVTILEMIKRTIIFKFFTQFTNNTKKSNYSF